MKKKIVLISCGLALVLSACGRAAVQTPVAAGSSQTKLQASEEDDQEAGVPVEVDVLEGRPHGYGYMEGWIPAYAEWLENVFANN